MVIKCSMAPKLPISDVLIVRKFERNNSRGFIWLQNVSKQRPIEIGIFIAIFVLFLVVLILVLVLRHPPEGKNLSTARVDSHEQDKIKPLEYDSDITATSEIKNKLRMVTRLEWVAQPPSNITTPLVTPVPYVIIHHTATANCSSIAQCVLHVRLIQTFHIDSKGFFDIGYNFLVGGDGAAYEGRGWTIEGAHSFGYNARSIGIAFIGTFIRIKPPDIQILACKRLIEQGVQLGYIRKDYKLLGARQLAGTESPGAALLEDMKTWNNWAAEP